MNKISKVLLTAFIGCSLLFNACKEKEFLQSTLIPAVDNINTFFTDTFGVVANNIVFDSFKTSSVNTSLTYQRLVLGTIANDGAFGATEASFALQLKQPTSALTFPTGIKTIDSLVLSMPITGYYGDSVNSVPQTFNVYRLSNAMNLKDSYYNSTILPYDAQILGTGSIDFPRADTVTLGNGTKEKTLRIRLSAAFADSLLNLKDTSEYKTYANFATWLRGLYVAPNGHTTGKNLGVINMDNIHMKMYFRNNTGSKIDTLTFDYSFNKVYNAFYNKISHDHSYNNPSIKNLLYTGNIAGDSTLFVQSDCGAAVLLKFPNIATYKNAMVNKAELEFTVVATNNMNSDTAYRTPFYLRAYGVDKNGLITNLLPEVTTGFRIVVTENGEKLLKYQVNITRNFQRALSTKNADFKILLKGYNFAPGCGRVTLGGTNRILNKSKLNVIYTKI
jgi:hypothetical protein